MNTVTIGVASHPPRRDALPKSIESLLPQCDRLCLYLNNYSASIIDELPESDKLEIVLAGTDPDTGEQREYPDIHCHGKLHWIDKCDGYYLTCDDDIIYPLNYVDEMIRTLRKYDDKVIVSCGGGVKNKRGITSWYTTPKESNDYDTPVNHYSGACMIMHPKTIGAGGELTTFAIPDSDNYIEDCIAEDACISVWANVNDVPMVLKAKDGKWIQFIDGEYNSRFALEKQPQRWTRGARQIKKHFAQYNMPVSWKVVDVPINDTLTYSDGDRAIPENTNEQITIAMASHPPREQGMLRRISELLPQCDRLCLYLNSYPESILKRLPKSDKLEVVLAGDGRKHADISSFGKLFWCGKYDGYYFTVDDDNVFPPNYTAIVTDAIDRYDGRAIITLRGVHFKRNYCGKLIVENGIAKESAITYHKGCKYNMQVHVCGNGATAYVPNRIGISWESMGVDKVIHPDGGDDITVAIWALRNRVPIVRIACDANWLQIDWDINSIGALHRRDNKAQMVTERAMRENWNLPRFNA